MNPIFTFLFVSFLYKTLIDKVEKAGLALGILGGAFMLKIWDLNLEIFSPGNIYFLLASLTWPILTIISGKQNMKSAILFSFYMFLFTTIIQSILIGFNISNIFKFDFKFWVNILILSLWGTTFATTVYFYTVDKLGSKIASSFFFLVPVSAIIFSKVFLKENITLSLIIGGFLGLIAVYILNTRKKVAVNKSNFSKTNFKPHVHDNFSIGIITGGECKLNIKNEKKLIKKSEIRIINPLQTHYVENNNTWSYINLFLEKDYVYNIASSITSLFSEIIFSNKIEDMKIKNLFTKIISINNLNHIQSEEILIELIENLIKKHSIIDVKEHKFDFNKKELLDYIYANYLEDIKLEDLEKIAGVNKYHIIRIFKKHFLLTPYQFILKLRINHSLELIKKDYPLSLIAVECGFFDQSHFIKEFKKIYGLTPLNFIKHTNLSQNTE